MSFGKYLNITENSGNSGSKKSSIENVNYILREEAYNIATIYSAHCFRAILYLHVIFSARNIFKQIKQLCNRLTLGSILSVSVRLWMSNT